MRARWLVIGWVVLGAASLALSGLSAAGASDREATISTPRPMRWLPSKGSSCRRVHGKGKVCDGPRRVPEPQGGDAVRAEELGLGTMETAQHLLSSVPKASW